MSAPLHHILFLDIETVPQYADYHSLPKEWLALWDLKSASLLKYHEEETTETIYHRAGIYAEFGKIICISCGVIQGSGDTKKIILKSFYGDDEKLVLSDFCEMIKKWSGSDQKYLCAHNGKEFDYPYLCRRLIINNLSVPSILNISGKKPWEVAHFDTLELWKFGDYKHYTSIKILAKIFGIPTPKDDIDGSQVRSVYYEQGDLDRIEIYCKKDVATVARLLQCYKGEQPVGDEQVVYV